MRCVRVLDSFIWFYSSFVCIIECVCIDCRVRSSDQWSNRFAHDVHGTRGQTPALLGGVTEVAQPPSRPHWSCLSRTVAMLDLCDVWEIQCVGCVVF